MLIARYEDDDEEMLEGDGEDDDGSVKLSEADRNTTKWWMIAGCPHLSSRQGGKCALCPVLTDLLLPSTIKVVDSDRRGRISCIGQR